MNLHDRRIQHKRKKARRNLESKLTHYAHNKIVMQLGITSYLDSFCRDNKGEVHYDTYIQNYVERYKDKMRDIAE